MNESFIALMDGYCRALFGRAETAAQRVLFTAQCFRMPWYFSLKMLLRKQKREMERDYKTLLMSCVPFMHTKVCNLVSNLIYT